MTRVFVEFADGYTFYQHFSPTSEASIGKSCCTFEKYHTMGRRAVEVTQCYDNHVLPLPLLQFWINKYDSGDRTDIMIPIMESAINNIQNLLSRCIHMHPSLSL
jgi:hypothetical protein